MKTNLLYKIISIVAICGSLAACDDFLDKEPLSNVAPEQFFAGVSQLESYANDIYPKVLPGSGNNTYGFYSNDAGTDNQVGVAPPNRFTTTEWKVSQDNKGNWTFETIYRINFFFSNVKPRYEAKNIVGQEADIKHSIGEMYFLRALEYFNRYRQLGDFPIITESLVDDREKLIAQSKRMPRNEVARFIINNLDSAALFMVDKDLSKNRINRDVALLLKSRVALFEGTWLKYFKGSAFVPNGDGWPGKEKDYNANYQFPSGSIENEIDYFLSQAMESSKEIADKYKGKLAVNTGSLQQSVSDPANPYYDMFASEKLENFEEVLLWRDYARDVQGNDIALATNGGNWGVGLTRSYVQNFLMDDGRPVYAHGDYSIGGDDYKGDNNLTNVVKNRDTRLSLFLKVPDQVNLFTFTLDPGVLKIIEPTPDILNGADQYRYTTGYTLRKGGAFDTKFYQQNQGFVAIPVYRAAEALLNYMEASYEKEGSLNSTAREYWKLLRQRAQVNDDIDKTLAATIMSKEAENDFGAYSVGQILTDVTLYNIRRERRSELLSEGLRWMDLCRWRSVDQLKEKPYIPEGMHLWNTEMEAWYEGNLIGDGSSNANVSSKDLSEYLRPYQRRQGQIAYNGFVWKMAHYLEPIRADEFLLTASDGESVDLSPIYQNPYWPTRASEVAEK